MRRYRRKKDDLHESRYPVHDHARAGEPADNKLVAQEPHCEGERHQRAGSEQGVKAVRADQADDETNEKQ